jgi:hypothetical protein
MGQPLDGDGFNARIRDDDLFPAQSGRVPVIGRLGIGLQQLAKARQTGKKLHRQDMSERAQVLFRPFRRRVVFEAFVDLILEVTQDDVHEGGRFDLDLGGMNQLFIKKARE